MKTMTCEELGGACGMEFQAETFEEIAEMSMRHGMEMFQKADGPHLAAMEEMKAMRASGEMNGWNKNVLNSMLFLKMIETRNHLTTS